MTSGQVSIIQGRRQRPALRIISLTSWLLAGIGALGTAQPFSGAGLLAIILVTAAPLLRVGWLIFRWGQERDWRFVWTAIALLVVIAGAGLVAVLGQ